MSKIRNILNLIGNVGFLFGLFGFLLSLSLFTRGNSEWLFLVAIICVVIFSISGILLNYLSRTYTEEKSKLWSVIKRYFLFWKK